MKFWRKEFSKSDIEFILSKVRKFRKISLDGSVSLVGPSESHAATAFLVTALNINIRTDSLREKIVERALFSIDLPENFSETDFKNIIYKLRHQYEDVERTDFRIVFPIWDKPSFLSGIKKVKDVSLNFTPSAKTRRYKKIVSERRCQSNDPDFASIFTDEIKCDLERCTLCIAHVKAYSYADANERASDALYQILGMVNLAHDGGKYWRMSFRTGGKLPVSDVLIGPHTTSHLNNGELTHRGFWREEWTAGPRPSSLNSQYILSWEKHFERLRVGLHNSRWQEACSQAASQYFKAFANPNLKESFLEGWRLFESISGTQNEKVSDQIIRVSNLYTEQAEPRIVGKHLALRRNLITHGNPIEIDDYEVIAFQMLQFINPFMQIFILNGFSLNSLQEFWEFLSLPTSKTDRHNDQIELERRLALLNKASKFRAKNLEEK